MIKTRAERLLDIEGALAALVADPVVPDEIQKKLAAISMAVWRERRLAEQAENV